jgi:hypothetical protein
MLLPAAVGRAADLPSLQNVDRRIAKQPEYHSKRPLYGLLVFGPAAEKRISMVLDQSKPAIERYDLLYIDLNANGDLTEPTERRLGEIDDNDIRFQLPDLKVFVGQPGVGASTFWAFQEHFLPEREGVKATLIYRDAQDKELRLTCLLKERC